MVPLVEYQISDSEDEIEDKVLACCSELEHAGNSKLLSSAVQCKSAVLTSVDHHSDMSLDYFNIGSTNSMPCVKEDLKVSFGKSSSSDNQSGSDNLLSNSVINHHSSFWSSELPPCDWNSADRIWGMSADPSDGSSQQQANSICGAERKHAKPSEQQSASFSCKRLKLFEGDTAEPGAVDEYGSKSCFVVHPKVAPHLKNTFSRDFFNRCPKYDCSILPGHSGPVNRIEWCVAEYAHLLLSASMDSTVRVWNCFATSSQPCVRSFNYHTKAVKDAVWFGDGRHVVSSSFDKTARVCDVEHGKELCTCSHEDFVTCVKVFPLDNNMFVTGLTNILLGWDRRIAIKPIRHFKYKDRFGQVQDICFLRNKTQFVSSADLVSRDSADRNIMAWDFSTGAVLSNQIYHERYTCTRLRAHPTLPVYLAQTHGDYIAEFSDIPPYRINKCKRFEKHKVAGYGVGFDISPDGKMVASGSSDGQMVVYDYRVARILGRLRTNNRNDVILDVAWNPVLVSTVAAGTWSGDLVVWH